MVNQRSLRWVPWRSTTSLFFHVTLNTLIHFWQNTQNSNNNINNLLTNCWVKYTMFYKMEILAYHICHQHNVLIELNFTYSHTVNLLGRCKYKINNMTLHSRKVTLQRNAIININENRLLIYFSSLSKYIVPWKTSYQGIFNLFFLHHVLLKPPMVVFADVFEEFYTFAVITEPFRTSF